MNRFSNIDLGGLGLLISASILLIAVILAVYAGAISDSKSTPEYYTQVYNACISAEQLPSDVCSQVAQCESYGCDNE